MRENVHVARFLIRSAQYIIARHFSLISSSSVYKERFYVEDVVHYFLAMAALFLLLVGTAIAQPDEGEFLILSAQYGIERHHVDVTGRLKELAAHDRTFRVNHDSMRVDPAEGRSKALRIYARGPNGGERMFEYVDGSVVDGGMFRAWGRAANGATAGAAAGKAVAVRGSGGKASF